MILSTSNYLKQVFFALETPFIFMNTRKLFMQSGIQFSRCALYFNLFINFASYRQPNERCNGRDEITGTDNYTMSSACNLIGYPPVVKGLGLVKHLSKGSGFGK